MQQCILSVQSTLSFTAVAFREISSTSLRKLLLTIEYICQSVGFRRRTGPTIVAGLLRQSCLIKVSLLGGAWMANDGSLREAGGVSFVNFVKIEDFGG